MNCDVKQGNVLHTRLSPMLCKKDNIMLFTKANMVTFQNVVCSIFPVRQCGTSAIKSEMESNAPVALNMYIYTSNKKVMEWVRIVLAELEDHMLTWQTLIHSVKSPIKQLSGSKFILLTPLDSSLKKRLLLRITWGIYIWYSTAYSKIDHDDPTHWEWAFF